MNLRKDFFFVVAKKCWKNPAITSRTTITAELLLKEVLYCGISSSLSCILADCNSKLSSVFWGLSVIDVICFVREMLSSLSVEKMKSCMKMVYLGPPISQGKHGNRRIFLLPVQVERQTLDCQLDCFLTAMEID